MTDELAIRRAFLGRWRSTDPMLNEVETEIAREGGTWRVSVRDRSDGEVAEVRDVRWDGEGLSYATYWPSTGRSTKSRMRVLAEGRLDHTFTHSDQEILERVPPDEA